jgi:hypothetical protein
LEAFLLLKDDSILLEEVEMRKIALKMSFAILLLFCFCADSFACYKYIERGILHPAGKLQQEKEREESWQIEVSPHDKIRWLKKEQESLLERIDWLEELNMSDWSYIEALEARIQALEEKNEKMVTDFCCTNDNPCDYHANFRPRTP